MKDTWYYWKNKLHSNFCGNFVNKLILLLIACNNNVYLFSNYVAFRFKETF